MRLPCRARREATTERQVEHQAEAPTDEPIHHAVECGSPIAEQLSTPLRVIRRFERSKKQSHDAELQLATVGKYALVLDPLTLDVRTVRRGNIEDDPAILASYQ